MEYYKSPKIRFYRIRTFGQILSIAFDYLRETWRPILKFSLYFILPLCLLQSFAVNSFYRDYLEFIDDELSSAIVRILIQYGLYVICLLVGQAVLSALVFGLMKLYEQRNDKLNNLTFDEVKAVMKQYMKKMLNLILFGIVIVVVVTVLIGGLAMLSLWTLIVTVPLVLIGFLIAYPPLILLTPLYMFENRSIFEALNRAFRYGLSYWIDIFGVAFVFGLISGILNTVTMMPWYIVTLFGELLSLNTSDMATTQSVGYQFTTYVLGIIQSYGMYISQVITLVGVAFQYFHIIEKREGVAVKSEISNFENL